MRVLPFPKYARRWCKVCDACPPNGFRPLLPGSCPRSRREQRTAVTVVRWQPQRGASRTSPSGDPNCIRTHRNSHHQYNTTLHIHKHNESFITTNKQMGLSAELAAFEAELGELAKDESNETSNDTITTTQPLHTSTTASDIELKSNEGNKKVGRQNSHFVFPFLFHLFSFPPFSPPLLYISFSNQHSFSFFCLFLLYCVAFCVSPFYWPSPYYISFLFLNCFLL